MKKLIFPVLLVLSWLFFFIYLSKLKNESGGNCEKFADSLIIHQTVSKPDFVITTNSFEEELKKDSSLKFNNEDFNEEENYESIKVFYDCDNDIRKIEIKDYNTEVLVDYIVNSKHTEFKRYNNSPKISSIEFNKHKKAYTFKKNW